MIPLNVFLSTVLTYVFVSSPCFCTGDYLFSDKHGRNFYSNSTQIKNLTSEIFPPIPGIPFNISSIDDIIHQIFNQTIIPTSTTALPPINGSTTPVPQCQCGKGGKPKVPRREYEADDDDLEESIEDDKSESLETERESAEEEDDDQIRIVHGIASHPNAWPWMAGLIVPAINPTGEEKFLFCGGTLINSQYVLTAAHCFKEFPNNSFIISQVSVLLGSNSIKSNVTDRVQSRIIDARIHPKYNNLTSENDITILKLAVPVTFTDTIRPICLSQKGTPFNSRKAIAAGWGTANVNGSTSQPYLREAGLRVIPNAKCKGEVPGLTRNMICALGVSPATNTNVCRGDSGGPLMIYKPKTKTFTQIGLTSFGGGSYICGQKGVPAVYTRVNNYLRFIRDVTSGTDFCSNSFSP